VINNSHIHFKNGNSGVGPKPRSQDIFQIYNLNGIDLNKNLDNSNYDNLHGGGDFSHAYVIMHTCFGKKLKMLKMNTS
jgi:hypothetical protein